jgi:superfamily I DNA/RNA helicase
VENPRDKVAALRVLQLLPGFGSTTARRVIEQVEGIGDVVRALTDFRAPPSAGAGTTEDIEEERRLLYVAMTRAKDHLHPSPLKGSSAASRRSMATTIYAARTRFIPLRS